MAIREILRMGDARLLRVAQPVMAFDTPELHALVADMFETMAHAKGAGLAAPQIGVDLQLVIFGFDRVERYPDAPAVPKTVLINPTVTPLSFDDGTADEEDGWEGCLSVPGLRGVVPRHRRIRYTGFDLHRSPMWQFSPIVTRERITVPAPMWAPRSMTLKAPMVASGSTCAPGSTTALG